MKSWLSEKDRCSLKEKGYDLRFLTECFAKIEQGTSFAELDRPAVAEDGILCFSPEQQNRFAEIFSRESTRLDLAKFVPASGAATRMFRFLQSLPDPKISNSADPENSLHRDFSDFIGGLQQNHFAFARELKQILKKNGYDFDRLLAAKDYQTVVDFLLSAKGLNYLRLPKALIKFHTRGQQALTPLEEHLNEAEEYLSGRGGFRSVHFTVPEGFIERIRDFAETGLKAAGQKARSTRVSFSIQNPLTNTPALDLNGQPVRNENGGILLRPAGHGALLENLNRMSGDLIFIRNIDNVVPKGKRHVSNRYRKIMAGFLLSRQQQIFSLLKKLKNRSGLDEAGDFVFREMGMKPPHAVMENGTAARIEWCVSVLNRPIRVCGMVKNQGEPGGGPFWVRNPRGTSLQIVESAQIDFTDSGQKKIAGKATHFNPVDLVCAIRNFEGKKFNLQDYVDPDTCFVSDKSFRGRAVRALELPGLWNGAMAEWITFFVEVPSEIFAPVKTVNDLLRSEHRGDCG